MRVVAVLALAPRIVATASLLGFALTGLGSAQTASPPPARSVVVRVAPTDSADGLLHYPDETTLALPDGSYATVADLRRFSNIRALERESMLTFDTPASVTIHFIGGDASRARYDAAISAATSAASVSAACSIGRRDIAFVDGFASGIAFAPGASYRITGCGFGSGGRVAIAAPTGSGPLVLSATKWSNTEIDATLPSTVAGLSDQTNVTLTVTPNGGSPLRQAGYAFIAARESVLVGTLDSSDWRSSKGPYEPAGFGHSTAGVTDGSVTFAKTVAGRCDLDATRDDVFSVASIPLAAGFGVESISITNTVSQLTMDNDDVTEVLSSPFAVSALGVDGVDIRYQLNSTYRKPASATAKAFRGLVRDPLPFFAVLREGTSACSGGYDISVTVTGPRGVPPLAH